MCESFASCVHRPMRNNKLVWVLVPASLIKSLLAPRTLSSVFDWGVDCSSVQLQHSLNP